MECNRNAIKSDLVLSFSSDESGNEATAVVRAALLAALRYKYGRQTDKVLQVLKAILTLGGQRASH